MEIGQLVLEMIFEGFLPYMGVVAMFVWVEALRPRQQFFSQVGTEPHVYSVSADVNITIMHFLT